MRRYPRDLGLILAIVGASACGSSSEATPDAAPVVTPDAPPPPVDAAPPDVATPDAMLPAALVCLGMPRTAASVPDPIHVGVTVIGIGTSTPTEGVTVEVRKWSDDSVITSGMTAANGKVSLTVASGGQPVDVYYRLSADGDRPRDYLPPGPLFTTDIVSLELGTAAYEEAAATALGTTLDPDKGIVAVQTLDCGSGGGSPLAGVTASFAQGGTPVYADASDHLVASQSATSANGFFIAVNVGTGESAMHLDYGNGLGVDWRIKAFAGELSVLFSNPRGYPQ